LNVLKTKKAEVKDVVKTNTIYINRIKLAFFQATKLLN